MRDFEKIWDFFATLFPSVKDSSSAKQQEDNQNVEQQSLQRNNNNKKRNAFIRQRSTEEIGRNRIFEPTRRRVTTRE